MSYFLNRILFKKMKKLTFVFTMFCCIMFIDTCQLYRHIAVRQQGYVSDSP